MKFALSFLITIITTTCFAGQKGLPALSLDYSVSRDSANTKLLHFEAKITNHTSEDIYFLSESCNGLDAYLTTTSSAAQIYSAIHCFISFPVKEKVEGRGSFSFNASVLLTQPINQISLNLNFYQIEKEDDLNDQTFGEIHSKYKTHICPLQGPVVEI